MSEIIIPVRFVCREGTVAEWASNNEVLKRSEIGVEWDTLRCKIGNGVTAWNALPYSNIRTLADLRIALDLLGSTAQGDLIYKGASGWTRLPKGSDGQIVKLAAGLPTWANESAGAGGAMTQVGTATVTPEMGASTLLTLSGLDLAADGHYVLLVNVGNATASSISLSLQYNGNTTATNYYRILQSVNAGGATVSAANSAIFSGAAASQSMWARIEIEADHAGRTRAVFGAVRDVPATMVYQPGIHVYDVVANVTSLTVSSSVAASLAIGSSIKLFKVQ